MNKIIDWIFVITSFLILIKCLIIFDFWKFFRKYKFILRLIMARWWGAITFCRYLPKFLARNTRIKIIWFNSFSLIFSFIFFCVHLKKITLIYSFWLYLFFPMKYINYTNILFSCLWKIFFIINMDHLRLDIWNILNTTQLIKQFLLYNNQMYKVIAQKKKIKELTLRWERFFKQLDI